MSKVTMKHVIDKALSQKGKKESPAGSNKTPYGAWYGMNGVPWCAEYVSWCFKDDLSLIHGKYARTDAKAKALHKRNLLHIGTSGLKKGDVVFFDFGRSSFEGRYLAICHTGICLGRLSDGRYIFIEGNTGVGNNANGGQVMVRYRSASNVAAYFRSQYKTVPKKKPTTKATVKTVTASKLNVRTGAGSNHRVIGHLNHKAKVTVLSKHAGWYKIKFGSKTGYVSAAYVK